MKNLAKGTATDIDGHYFLELDTGYYKVVCGYVGLKSDTFFVHIVTDVIVEKNIALKAEAKMLETIVVSSGRFEQKIEELTLYLIELKKENEAIKMVIEKSKIDK